MKLRWFYRYSIGSANPGVAGNKERRLWGEKVLQYFDNDKNGWLDVPEEFNKAEREKMKKNLWKKP